MEQVDLPVGPFQGDFCKTYENSNAPQILRNLLIGVFQKTILYIFPYPDRRAFWNNYIGYGNNTGRKKLQQKCKKIAWTSKDLKNNFLFYKVSQYS